MFDLGWSEMAVVALVALIVLGPKELPKALKTVAFWVRKARRLAREFQSGVDELIREAELDEAKKTIQTVGRVNVDQAVEKTIDPTGEVSRAIRSGPEGGTTANAAVAPSPPPKPAADVAETAPPTAEPESIEPAPRPTEAPTVKSA